MALRNGSTLALPAIHAARHFLRGKKVLLSAGHVDGRQRQPLAPQGSPKRRHGWKLQHARDLLRCHKGAKLDCEEFEGVLHSSAMC